MFTTNSETIKHHTTCWISYFPYTFTTFTGAYSVFRQ